jgi:hypothetical protein
MEARTGSGLEYSTGNIKNVSRAPEAIVTILWANLIIAVL